MGLKLLYGIMLIALFINEGKNDCQYFIQSHALQVIAPILFDEQRVSNIVSSITYDGENTWWKQTFCGKHIVFDPGND